MNRTVLPALVLAAVAAGALPALALAGAETEKPDAQVVVHKIVLEHLEPHEAFRLLYRGQPEPAAAERPDEVLVPEGIEGMVVYPRDRSLILRGTAESIKRLARGLRVVDVPRLKLPDNRLRVTIAPVRVVPETLRRAALDLTGAGAATLEDGRLTLEGSPVWIHQALRLAIRAELR